VVPNKVFQGAAAGCAIITSDTGAPARVFGDAIVLVPPGDADALAAALLSSRGTCPAPLAATAARELAEKRFSRPRWLPP